VASTPPAPRGEYEQERPKKIFAPEYTPVPWMENKKVAVIVVSGGWVNSIQAVLEDLFRGRGANVVALSGNYGSPYFTSSRRPSIDFVAEARLEEYNCGYYSYGICVRCSLRIINSDNTVVAVGIGDYFGGRNVVYWQWGSWGNYYQDRYRAYTLAARAAVNSLR